MREISLRRLLRGPVAEPDRIALLSIWFKDHNNPRYAELLPRLERLDAMLLRLSHRQVPRGFSSEPCAGRGGASTGWRCRTPRSAIAAY